MMNRKIHLTAFLFAISFGCIFNANAQTKVRDGSVSGTTIFPVKDAILELESANRGLLYPRVALISTDLPSPLSAHVEGMVVYDTATSGSGITAVSPGIYYNDGTKWVRLRITSAWYKSDTVTAATNTDNQYVMGNVAVGQSSASFAKLTVNTGGDTTLPVLQLKAPFTGNAKDSLLTWNPIDSTVRKMPVSAIVNPPFTGGNCANTPISTTGGSSACAVYDSSCTIVGSYVFTFVTGDDFAQITVLDAGSGQFSINFDPNTTAANRQAIVMVTSPCGTTTMLIYTQNGDQSLCAGATTVPAVAAVGSGTTMCSGGAAYLYLTGYPTTGTFIWTLNGQAVGNGNNYTATAPGKYIVYSNAVGCAAAQTFQLTLNTGAAPDPVQILAIGNNGVACGAGGTIQIITSAPASGTVIWFKNGVLQTGVTGATINAGAGVWTAAVQNGSCYSAPSQPVTVTENTSATASIATPQMMINGASVSGPTTLCTSAALTLQVSNPDPALTYTWYINNANVGTGTGVYYPMTGFTTGSQLVVGLMASGGGSCPVQTLINNTIGTGTAPSAPAIQVSTPGNALCGGQAVLTATGSASDTYIWFYNGAIISGQTAQSITVTQIGSYTVAEIANSCQSVKSGAANIVSADFATASWQNKTDTVSVGDNKSYSIVLNNTTGATYNWAVSNGATITSGQGTNSINVNFTNAGTVTIPCTAGNACGNILNNGGVIIDTVIVNNLCTNAGIVNGSAGGNHTITAGSGAATMSITAAGTLPVYQWYSNTAASTTGGTAISGATSSSYSFTSSSMGTYYFYCVAHSSVAACASATVTSGLFTVNVQLNAANLPAGTGSFTGMTCFDVAKSNDNANGCGTLANRTSQVTDFTLRTVSTNNAPYTGVQVYTFTPSAAVSKVRFQYNDPAGMVIDSIVPSSSSYATGTNISTACTVTVYYKSSLETSLVGLTHTNALQATLYAVYNNNAAGTGTDMAVPLTATLGDCACCGAATAGGGWLNFMCYNLGADQSLPPYTPAQGLHGAMYQWGYATPVLTAAQNIANNGHVSGWNSSAAGTTDGNGNWNMTSANPCPAGWVVPTGAQWTDVINNNTWTRLGTFTDNSTNWTAGVMVGGNLFLPAAGYRIYSDGTPRNRGYAGYYWSSTPNGASAYGLTFLISNLILLNTTRSYGFPVRCVVVN